MTKRINIPKDHGPFGINFAPSVELNVPAPLTNHIPSFLTGSR